MPDSSSPAGDAESSSGLMLAIRKFFDPDFGDRSLRAQLEEAIDEHEEGEHGDDVPENSGTGDLSLVERQMLRNLLHFSEHDADDVAVPRGEIIAMNANASWDELVETFAEHGHSRMPVYREQLDDVIGMIHIKDVFTILARGETPPRDWTVLMRQPLYVPQTRNALDVLADMRAQRMHLAVVVDEFSGTDGIITIEDLVEEIVGDIEDEHDIEAGPTLTKRPDGTIDADARCEVEELEEMLGLKLTDEEEENDVDTLGGLVFSLVGRVPLRGELISHPAGLEFEVKDADPRRIKKLRIHLASRRSTEKSLAEAEAGKPENASPGAAGEPLQEG